MKDFQVPDYSAKEYLVCHDNVTLIVYRTLSVSTLILFMIVFGDYVFKYFKDLKKKISDCCKARSNQVENFDMNVYAISTPNDVPSVQFGNPEDNPDLQQEVNPNVIEHIR